MNNRAVTVAYLLSKVEFEDDFGDTYYPKSMNTLVLLLLSKKLNGHEAISKQIYEMAQNDYQPIFPKTICTEVEGTDCLVDFFNREKMAIKRDTIEQYSLLTEALSIYVYGKGMDFLKAADLSLSLNLEAIRGELGAFDERLHAKARPYPGQLDSARNTLKLLKGSKATTDEGRYSFGYDQSPRCQDSISYRAAPQTHGGVRDTLRFLRESLEEGIDYSTEVHHQLRYALDFVMIGLADLGNISERRSFRLTDTHLSYGLTTNLVYDNPGFNHGFPVVQAVSTAVLGELKTATLPSRLSFNTDMNSMLPLTAAIRAFDSMKLISKIIAVEVYMSTQGMDLVKQKVPSMAFGAGTSVAYSKIRTSVDLVEGNRYLVPDLLKIDHLIYKGELVECVEGIIGELK